MISGITSMTHFGILGKEGAWRIHWIKYNDKNNKDVDTHLNLLNNDNNISEFSTMCKFEWC